MPYVLLTASPRWAGYRDRQLTEALTLMQQYGDQVDASDHDMTVPTDTTRGGRLRHVSIPFHPDARPSTNDEALTLAARWIVAGFRLAKAQARGGSIGVFVGHPGFTSGAYVDLAPQLLLRLTSLEPVWRTRQGTNRWAPLREHRTFEEIGEVLRRRPRVSRVDIYSAAVTEPGGQDLLDWMHYLWRIPVRALRGGLGIDGNMADGAVAIPLRPPGPVPRRHRFDERFSDQILTGPRMWLRSRNRRPALSPSPPSVPPPPGGSP